MKVRMTTDRAEYGREQYTGEVHDFPEEEARRLIAADQAEAVEEPRPQPQPQHKKRGK